jgi:hypothetical protein
LVNIAAWFGSQGACSNAYCRSGQRPSGASKRTTYSEPVSNEAAEQKLRRRQLTEDGNVEITGRDLREGSAKALGAQPKLHLPAEGKPAFGFSAKGWTRVGTIPV